MLGLVKIRDMYYFRLRVPHDVKQWFPSPVLKKSLKVRKFDLAKRLARGLLGESERVFTMIRSKTLDAAGIQKIIADFMESVLELKYDAAEDVLDESQDIMQEIYAESHKDAVDKVRRRGRSKPATSTFASDAVCCSATFEPSMLPFTHIPADHLCETAGYAVDPSSPEFKMLLHQLAIAKRDIIDTLQERLDTGDSTYDKKAREKEAAKPKSHTLNEALQAYITDKGRVLRKRKEKAAKLLECFQCETNKSDISLADIDRELTRRVALRLQKYPLHRNLKYKGLSLDQIEKLEGVRYPALTTQSEELFFMSSVYDFAINNFDGLTRNFAKGLADKLVDDDKRKANEYRDIFRPDDLQEILRELRRRKDKGEFAKNPHLLFIPLIAMFQGCRANEICQLHVTDIECTEGSWCININEDTDEKSVKNENSRRINPIHPALVDLGLIRFWESQKAKGCVRLWEGEGKISCAYYDAKGNSAHYFTKWFNNTFKKQLKLSNPEKQSFHSFRHTVANWFYQNLKMVEHAEAVTAILGHLNKEDQVTLKSLGWNIKAETFATYAKELNLKKQLETLQLLDYGIDLSELKII